MVMFLVLHPMESISLNSFSDFFGDLVYKLKKIVGSFLDGDVPRSTSYGVYISQLIRFARASSYVTDFNGSSNIAIVRSLPCEPNISCTSTTAESRAKIWYQ